MGEIHVTDLLSLFDRGLGFVPPHILAEKARIGTETHRYCLGYVRAGGFMIDPPDDIAPYYLKFVRWFEEHVEEVFIWNGKPVAEYRFYHPMGFTGKIDLIPRMKGDRFFSIVDLKRVYAIDEFVRYQLAGYQLGAEHAFKKKFPRRFALHIPEDGECKAEEFKHHDLDRAGFLAAFQFYKIHNSQR